VGAVPNRATVFYEPTRRKLAWSDCQRQARLPAVGRLAGGGTLRANRVLVAR